MTPDQQADFAAIHEFMKKCIGLAVLSGEETGLTVRSACCGLVEAAAQLMAANGHSAEEIAGWLRGLAQGVEVQGGNRTGLN